MGKYNGKVDGKSIPQAQTDFLRFIANELAEANRLKILELRLNNKINGYDLVDGLHVNTFELSKKELEDHA